MRTVTAAAVALALAASWLAAQPAQTGLPIRDDGGKRLTDLPFTDRRAALDAFLTAEHGSPAAGAGLAEFGEVLEVVGAED